MDHFDDAIVGAGILGLAHAYQLARRGRRVVVFERNPVAAGASVRNFGMIWPIGQPAGERYCLARRSAELWRAVVAEAKLWHAPVGSLHLAYREDEASVLEEFAESAPAAGFTGLRLLEPADVLKHSDAVNPDGLVAALFSEAEINVDPREVVGSLPAHLTAAYGVTFVFGATVTGYDRPAVTANGRRWGADNLYVCSGTDLATLYPEALTGSGIVPCKLQMLRAAAPLPGWRLGPMLAAGLTLQHYKAFQECPSLPALKARIAEEMPEYNRWGIHVLVSQDGGGDLVLGDSHVYGLEAADPFRREDVDNMILRYLETFLRLPGGARPRVTERWHGVYGKHPERPWVLERPAPGVTLVTGVGGAGMTLSFGLAERIVAENLGTEKEA